MIERLNSAEPWFYALLRIVTGFLFMWHGTQKIFGVPGDQPPAQIASRFGAAGVIELVCGALIAIGLLTRLAAFIASGEMAFAYFIAHAPNGFLPILNRGELAVLYCFVFLYMVFRGSGIVAVDQLFTKTAARAPART